MCSSRLLVDFHPAELALIPGIECFIPAITDVLTSLFVFSSATITPSSQIFDDPFLLTTSLPVVNEKNRK